MSPAASQPPGPKGAAEAGEGRSRGGRTAQPGRAARLPEGSKEEIEAFIEAAGALGVGVILDEPLARHCTFRIGGPADLYAAVDDIHTLERLGDLAREHMLPLTVLGGGSNVLVSDLGIRGLVIANQTRGLGFHPKDYPELVVDSGVALAGLARWAIRESWSGLEWAVSVPGTVGGAVIGNAGAHGGQIADNLTWVLAASPGSGRQMLMADEMEFSYRDSILKRGSASDAVLPIVLQAGFRVAPGNVAEMTARADSFLARRRASQPVEPSAGSVFRNPPGEHAGRLVEVAGLKGHRIGGAQVSLRHANFIVNTGNARAAEVAELIRLIQRRVLESTGIGLLPEILYLGEWTESG
jgi:UDP-N-acetylmuramate dehydrogenase